MSEKVYVMSDFSKQDCCEVSLCVTIGVCRAIGVSNFQVHHLKELKEDCSVVPHVNQVGFFSPGKPK